MNCLTVEYGVETDVFRAPLFLPHPKDSIAKRNQRLLLPRRHDQRQCPLAQDNPKIGEPGMVRAVVARVGVPFLWIVEGRRACVPLVDVPVRAVERLHHLALLTPKAEREERKVRVVHSDGTCKAGQMIVQYSCRRLLAASVMSLHREVHTPDMIGVEISQVIRSKLEVG